MRHFVLGEALRDYLRCPQEYGYRYIYQAPEPPQTLQQWWDRAVRRTILSTVKEKLDGKDTTHDRIVLLWQLTTRNTPLDGNHKLDILGREALVTFWNWLDTVELEALAVAREVTFDITTKRAITVQLTADFVARRGNRRIHVLLAPPEPGILIQVAACDDEVWTLYNLRQSHANELTKLTQREQRALAGVIEQGWRGIGHKLIWPYRDGRCTACPYQDVCAPGDARRYLLDRPSKHKRILERIDNHRKLRSS